MSDNDISKFKEFNFSIDFEDILRDNAKELSKNIAKDSKALFGASSPYANDWSFKMKNKKKNEASAVVYNKNYYRLSHLLEFGHAIWNSRIGKRTTPKPHILPNYLSQKPKFIEQMERAKINEKKG